MTIVVLVKQVPDMNAVRVDAATGKARLSGKAMNSYDAFAVQHALTLKAKLGGDVVAVTAGPAAAKDALTRALAMGATVVSMSSSTTRTRATRSTWRTCSPKRSSRSARTSCWWASFPTTSRAARSGRSSPSCSGCRTSPA